MLTAGSDYSAPNSASPDCASPDTSVASPKAFGQAMLASMRSYARSHRLKVSACFTFSVLLHLALVWVLLNNDVNFGDIDRLPVLLVQWVDDSDNSVDAKASDQASASNDTTIREPQAPRSERHNEHSAAESFAQSLAATAFDPQPVEPTLAIEVEQSASITPPVEQPTIAADPPQSTARELRKIEIAPLQQLALQQRVLDAMQKLQPDSSSDISWQEDGLTYQARMKRAVSLGSMDLERTTVEITTATDTGARMRTQFTMKRLAFSQFSQVIDRWDPQVQLHDDQIVGRFHSNSAFYIGYDSAATPKFSGKVTTAARGFRTSNGGLRGRRNEVFQGGLETFTGRIELPQNAQPFSAEPDPSDAYVQRFADDAHIVFFEDGRYSWRDRRADSEQFAHYPEDRPTYFIAAADATLHVKGTVNGRVLVYSPERIVIEGNLVYADDPRTNRDADDYLGLVSDKYVDIARPYVTGRGDLHINAAIFARRRFAVTNIEHGRSALLSIYGSLTSGTITATEPRYATKIEFDPRLDSRRPPGFPATNRYEVDRSPEAWTEVDEQASL